MSDTTESKEDSAPWSTCRRLRSDLHPFWHTARLFAFVFVPSFLVGATIYIFAPGASKEIRDSVLVGWALAVAVCIFAFSWLTNSLLANERDRKKRALDASIFGSQERGHGDQGKVVDRAFDRVRVRLEGAVKAHEDHAITLSFAGLFLGGCACIVLLCALVLLMKSPPTSAESVKEAQGATEAIARPPLVVIHDKGTVSAAAVPQTADAGVVPEAPAEREAIAEEQARDNTGELALSTPETPPATARTVGGAPGPLDWHFLVFLTIITSGFFVAGRAILRLAAEQRERGVRVRVRLMGIDAMLGAMEIQSALETDEKGLALSSLAEELTRLSTDARMTPLYPPPTHIAATENRPEEADPVAQARAALEKLISTTDKPA